MYRAIYLLLFILALTFRISWAQRPSDDLKTRHRFAKMYLGSDFRYYPGNGTRIPETGSELQAEWKEMSDGMESRLLVGASHFWGHADFFLAIPLVKWGEKDFLPGVETGARFYPWALKSKGLRPFAGISFQPIRFSTGEGTGKLYYEVPLSGGLTYSSGKHQFEIYSSWLPHNELEYYTGKTNPEVLTLPSTVLSLSYKYTFDITRSAEKDWESGKTKKLTDTLAALGRLNGFTIAAGASSSFFLGNSTYNSENLPWLGQHRFTGVFPEIGAGYYWHQPDLQVNVSARKFTSSLSAFNYTQELERSAITLETFKFLTDYHGFAFFMGPLLSWERWELREFGNAGRYSETETGVRPGLIAGWDIRPNRLQSFYLRTNMRWIPGLSIDKGDGLEFSYGQFELNFIQLVIFPGRFF